MTDSAAPYYTVLRGVGLALKTEDRLSPLPVQGRAASLALAQEISLLTTNGACSSSCSEHARHALAAWLDAGGTVQSPARPPPLGRATLDFQDLADDGHGLRGPQSVNWDAQERELRSKGWHIKRRGAQPTSHTFIRNLDVSPVFEVSNAYEVIAEGKGVSLEQSRRSAIAEAVERLSARSCDPREVFVASRRELDRLGQKDVYCWEAGPLDCVLPDLRMDWVRAFRFPAGSPAWVPAEAVYHGHRPVSGVAALGTRHSTGLACGSSFSEAFANAVLELIERDAYWTTMNCRLSCSDIDLGREALDPRATSLVQDLNMKGIRVAPKHMRLDWQIPIVHVLLIDEAESLPAFSHGAGAAFSVSTAFTRALTESVQMHTGLSKLCAAEWKDIVINKSGRGRHAWCSPLIADHLKHLYVAPATHTDIEPSTTPFTSIGGLCQHLELLGHKIFWRPIAQSNGLHVVRVLVEGLVPPTPQLGYSSPRLRRWIAAKTPRGAFGDPILF